MMEYMDGTWTYSSEFALSQVQKVEALEAEIKMYQTNVFQPLRCCDKPMNFDFATLTTPEIYTCQKCGHKIERRIKADKEESLKIVADGNVGIGCGGHPTDLNVSGKADKEE